MALSLSRSFIVLGTLAAGISAAAAGCSMTNRTAATGPSTAPSTAPAKGTTASKGGAELWAETCSRCHNLRSPSMFSDAQWEVALYDMRVRANLTGEEQRKILAFLQSANK